MCQKPCEQVTYTYESITQAWQPFLPGFRGFRKFGPLLTRDVNDRSAIDVQTQSWFHSPSQQEKDYQV